MLPPEKRSKLIKLLGMISSPHPGEVVNAAAAVTRLMSAADLTFETLIPPGQPEGKSTPEPSEQPQATAPVAAHEMESENVRKVILGIFGSGVPLREKDGRFLESILTKTSFGPVVSLSEKQWRWFADLTSRYGRAA
jgi:hypothetical protein